MAHDYGDSKFQESDHSYLVRRKMELAVFACLKFKYVQLLRPSVEIIPEDDWLLAEGIKRSNDTAIQRVVLSLHPAFLQGFLELF